MNHVNLTQILLFKHIKPNLISRYVTIRNIYRGYEKTPDATKNFAHQKVAWLPKPFLTNTKHWKKAKTRFISKECRFTISYLSNTTRLDQETELEQATSALNKMIDANVKVHERFQHMDLCLNRNFVSTPQTLNSQFISIQKQCQIRNFSYINLCTLK
jgi:alpha-L-fucosidase